MSISVTVFDVDGARELESFRNDCADCMYDSI